MIDLFKLTNQRASVTAARYEAGADITLIGRSARVVEAAAEIGTAARPVLSIVADLRDRSALVTSFETAVKQMDGLDLLVTCHGTVHIADSLAHDLTDWQDTLAVNLTSVFQLCQLAGRRMVAQGRGKIINIASMLSFSGALKVAAYAASKGGIAQMTKALANEWAAAGVNVNAIAPVYIKTQLNAHIWQDPARSPQVLTRLPSGRWGEPTDLNGAVIFLAAPWIRMDHLKEMIILDECRGDPNGWWPSAPLGQGHLELPALVAILYNAGFKCCLFIELANMDTTWTDEDAAVAASVSYLRPTGDAVQKQAGAPA